MSGASTVESRCQKSTTLRQQVMLDLIPQYPAHIATSQIHEKLITEGYKVTKRTVQRDLNLLKEWAGLDFEAKSDGNYWFRDLQRTGSPMPSASEAFILSLAEQSLESILPVDFRRRVDQKLATSKVVLSSNPALHSWATKLQVQPESYPLKPNQPTLSLEQRDCLYDCILKEYQVTLEYTTHGKSRSVSLVVNPLGLIIRAQSHYLVATKKSAPEKPILFLLHRISAVSMDYTKLQKPRSFDINEYFTKNPSGWLLSDETITIELKVKGYALDVVRYNNLGDNQQLIVGDVWSTVTFETTPTYDLIGWLLKYADDIIVVSPERIRNQVKTRLEKTLKNYL